MIQRITEASCYVDIKNDILEKSYKRTFIKERCQEKIYKNESH